MNTEQQIQNLSRQLTEAHRALGECYRLSGADADGNEDWRLAPFAVEEVKRLRAEFDQNQETLLSASTALHQAIVQCELHNSDYHHRTPDNVIASWREILTRINDPAPETPLRQMNHKP